MRRATGVAGMALAAILALLTIQAALAHSRPVRFDPAPGAVLASAPDRVTGPTAMTAS